MCRDQTLDSTADLLVSLMNEALMPIERPEL